VILRRRPAFWPAVLPAVLGLGLGLLALGRGYVLSYDMVFVPVPPLDRADLGFTGGPARAVPSDLVVALAAKIIPAEFVQKLILIFIFVLACTGAAALVATCWRGRAAEGRQLVATSRRGRAAGGRLPALVPLVAGVCYAWNPFVAERLILGQWAMLLGYAGLPWVARELAARSWPLRPWRLALALLPAAVGGFAAMSITVLVAVPMALAGGTQLVDTRDDASAPDLGPAPGGPAPDGPASDGGPAPREGSTLAGRWRRLGVTVGIIFIASLPWIIPSFVVPVLADPAGATAFAARADTPFGAVGSLLVLSGAWNAQAVPAGYGGGPVSVAWLILALTAVTGYLLVATRWRLTPGLGVAGCLGFCLAALGTWSPTLTALRDAIAFWPGFALLRDGQQFIAPLALVEAVGLATGLAALSAGAATPLAASRPAPPSTKLVDHEVAAASPSSLFRRWSFDRQYDGKGSVEGKSSTAGLTLLGIVALLAPLVLLPGLAWGSFGRLRAVSYPADWLSARTTIDSSRQPGSVLLLPWAQYRQYPWNHGEPVFDPWPRLLSRPMIWNDALTVGSLTVAPESQSARRLNAAITSSRPLTATLLAAGVRYVIVDAGPLLGEPRSRLDTLARVPGARIVVASRDLIVFRLVNRKVTIAYRSG
jgi:hypothetical protein